MSNRFDADFEFDNFQDIIELMCRAGWIQSAREDTDGVSVVWTALGKVKAREMASLVKPFAQWLRNRTGPKPDEQDQLICANSLAVYAREIGWPTDSELESRKLVVFVALLAPE